MIFKSNVKLCPTCIVCLFFSKQCKLYKSIIFFIDLQGFVISGTVIFLAVNPHLDLYIDYSIRYKKPHPIVIYTVYIIFFKLQFFCLEYNDGHLIVEYTMGNRAGMWILTPHFSEVCTIEQCSYDLRSYKSCVFIPRRIKLRCSEKYQHSTHGRFLGLNLPSLILFLQKILVTSFPSQFPVTRHGVCMDIFWNSRYFSKLFIIIWSSTKEIETLVYNSTIKLATLISLCRCRLALLLH